MAENITRIYELQVKLANESLQQLKKIQQSAKEIEDAFTKAGDKLKDFGRNLLAAVSVGAVVNAVKQTIDKFDELGAAAQRAGIGVETFSALAYAAEQADAELGDLEVGLKELQKSMVETGTKGANVLDALRIDKSQEPLQVLTEFAQKFKSIQDPALRTNAIIEVFGRSGLKLRPMLEQGAEGIKAAMERAKELGIVLDETTSEKMSDLDNAIKNMRQSAFGLGRQFTEGLAKDLQNVAEAFSKTGKEAATFNELGKATGFTLRVLASAAVITATGWQALAKAIMGVVAARHALRTGDTEGMMAFLRETRTDLNATLDTFEERMAALWKNAAEPPSGIDHSKPHTSGPIGDSTARVREALTTLDKANNKTKDAARAARELAAMWVKAIDEGIEAETKLALAAVPDHLSDRVRELIGLDAAEKFETELRNLDRLFFEERITPEQYERGIANLTKTLTPAEQETRALADETERLNELIGKKEMDEWIGKLQLLDKALADGRITLPEYTEAHQRLFGTIEKGAKESANIYEALADKVDGYAKQMSDAMIDFATAADDAKVSFGDMALSITRDITKMVTQMLIVEPLVKSLKTFITGFGGTSFGYTNPNVNALGNVFTSPDLNRYSGGIYDTPRVFRFAHGAGVFAEAGPEAIMPLSRGSDGKLGVDASGAGVTVNVINQAGAEVGVESKRNVNGEREINVLIQRAVSDGIARGRFDSVMGATYGVARRGH